jgi:site-specific DNA recombinase
VDNRGVIWARVSSDEQKGGYSLDAQERNLNDFAKAKGLQVVQTFRVAESASSDKKRKEFKACLNFIEKEAIPHLIAEKVDRVTRNLYDLARIYELMRNGLTVHFVREGMDVDDEADPSVHLTFNIIAAVAAYIARNIGLEARKGMLEKVRQGGIPFKCPIGYMPVPDPSDPEGKKRTVIVDPKRAPLVKWAFEEYAKGKHSLETLAIALNKKGLTTRPSPKHPDLAKPITVPTLAKMFDNRIFYGEVPWSGDVYEGKHTALISRDLFDQVQATLASRTSYIKPAAKKWFPFKEFLRCGYCGMSITAEDKPGGYIYYRCSDGRKVKDPDWYVKQFGQKRCIQPYHPQKDVDKMIMQKLGEIAINEAQALKLRAKLKATHAKQTEDERREHQHLLSEQTKWNNRLAAMQNLLYDGTITKEEYTKDKRGALSALASIQADLDRLTYQNVAYREQGAAIIEMMNGFKAVYTAADWRGKSEILSVVLDRIVLKGDDTSFVWHPRFQTLFFLAPFINLNEKGE